MSDAPTAIAPRPGWISRATFAVVRALRLSNPVEPTEDTYTPGADFASGGATDGGYSLRKAWYAYGINPWVQVCVERIAEDIASLPLVVEVDGKGGPKQVDKHPVLDLFARPNSHTSGRLFRMQNAADLVLAGNAPILPLKSSRGVGVVALQRLHPARVTAIPGPHGLMGWRYDDGHGSGAQYKAEDLVVIRSLSWADDPRLLMGTSPVQALAADLDADLAVANLTKKAAQKGRPDAIYHPKGDQRWGAPIVRAIKAALERALQDNHGGVAVLDGAGELEILGWTPRDMQGADTRMWTRQTVLSRFGVPPTIAGIPDAANYATAQMEQVTYWTRLQARAALLDDGFTEIARMAGYEGVRVRHDFSQVPALQDAQGASLARVVQWAQMGADPMVAARYEGFTDQPDGLWPLPDSGPAGLGVGGKAADVALNGAQVTSAQAIVGSFNAGQLSRDSAIAMLVEFFNMDPAAASNIVGSAPIAPASTDTKALTEARDEIAAALEILSDDDSTPEDIADARASLDAASLAVAAVLAAQDAA